MKRIWRSSCAALVGSLFWFNCRAQSQVAAFAASYAAEAQADYSTAVTALQAVYTGTYEQNVRLGWLFFLAKNYPAATAHYQQAVAQQPNALEAKFGLIKPLNALGQTAQVAQLYTDILHLDPQNTQANYWTGVIYFHQKAYSPAAFYFERVVRLYPFDYDATLALASTYDNLGKKAEARALYQRVLLIRPADATAAAGLGRL